MKPLRLTLKGFTGIRTGMGRDELTLDLESLTGDAQLVALVGPNGCGKTTIAENLHPFRLMPSRATSYSTAGFSFYDHLCAPVGGKELEWTHEGRRFRSQLVFRMNGARRTEAYLQEHKDGRWVPASIPDGTRSDGKTDTYDRCVEGLLGSPETFFTSAFHAQNRRQLSAYRPGEVKALLVELLALEDIRAAGQDAGRVAALLQQALERRREGLVRQQAASGRLEALKVALDQAADTVSAAQATKATAQASLVAAQEQLTAQEAQRAAAAGTEAMRQSLLSQIEEHTRRKAALLTSRSQAQAGFKSRRDRAARALELAVRDAGAGRAARERETAAAQALLARENTIRAAASRLPVLADDEAKAREALRFAERDAGRLAELQQRLQVIQAQRQALQREAGMAALRVQQLRERLRLADEVPCSGTSLQGECRLLGDAREAKALQPSADQKIGEVRRGIELLDEEAIRFRREADGLAGAKAQEAAARRTLDAVIEQRRIANAEAALVGQLGEALARIQRLGSEAAEAEQRLALASAAAQQEQDACDAAERDCVACCASDIGRLDTDLARLAQQLGALPPAFDGGKLAVSAHAVGEARRKLERAEATYTVAVTARAQIEGSLQSLQATVPDGAALEGAVRHLETELAMWTALGKALSNDGVIALCIDDAGPTLAALANDLLLNCYGPRFSVSIATQIETARKDLKEGFDVIVFDAETGASKSVAMMSGGERVWINEALTRAIAVYLAQSAGRRYQVLFSDEADGPLDPERKRMFVAMKRDVLRLGGYEQEIFVSQTPGLWALADCVIDVGSLSRGPVA